MSSHTNHPVEHVYTIDPAFATPKKVRDLADPFHKYVTPYCSSKLKEIASKIRSNANKRFKLREEGGEMRLIFWSEIKQVSESAETKPSPRSQQGELTENQIDHLIKMKRLALDKAESICLQKRKKVQDLLKKLEGLITKRNILSVQLKSLKKKNKTIMNQTSYGLFLKQIHGRQQQIINQIHSKIVNSSEYHIKISHCISEIPIVDHQILEKRLLLERLNGQLTRCALEEQRLMDEAAPHSMINCMFLVGVLKQQIYILILQKAERGKQGQVEKTGNRSHKIAQKMRRRTVLIECEDSSTVELRTFMTIYMHCKSLTLPNIVTIMNSLSFFSQEFKEIYHFKVFEMYVKNLIVGYAQKDPTKSEIICLNQAQTLKKRLIIIVRSEHEAFLKNILRLFQRYGDDYCISLNQMRMIMEVSVEDEPPLGLEVKDLPHPEHNELRLQFHNLPRPS